MKRVFNFLYSLLMIIPILFTCSACGKKPKENEEFNEFKNMALAIISRYEVDRSNDGPLLASNGVDTVEGILKADGEKVDTVNHYYEGFLNIAFYSPLAVGDAIIENDGASKFYGVTAKIIEGFEGYIQVEKNGTHTYIYAVGFNGGEDYLTYVDVEFTSINDYEINGYVVSPDESYFTYIYMDSEFNFQSAEKDRYAVISNGQTHFSSNDESVVSRVCDLVLSEIDLQSYKQKANGITTSHQHIVTKSQMETALTKYYNYRPTEGDYALTHGYTLMNGVVTSVNLEDQDFDLKIITLPRNVSVDTIDINLSFASCVEKVIIPANIKHIKVEQGQSIYDNFYMGKASCSWMDSDIEFIFEEGSTLFKKEDGNSYVNCDGQWKIFQLCNVSVFENESFELSNSGIRFSNITKSVDAYFKAYGYPALKNIILTNSIYDLVDAYPNSSDNIELDSLTLRNAVAYNEEVISSYMADQNIGFGIKRIKELVIDGYYSDCEYNFGDENNKLVEIDKLSIGKNCTAVKVNGYLKGDLIIPWNVTGFTSTNGFTVEGNLVVNANRLAIINGVSCTGTCTINIPITQNESSFTFESSGITASQGMSINYVENLEFDLSGKLSMLETELHYFADMSEIILNIEDLIVKTNGFEYKVFMHNLAEDCLVELDASNIDLTGMAKASLSIIATNANGVRIDYALFIIM